MCSCNTPDFLNWLVMFHFEANVASMCATRDMSFTIMWCGFYYSWNYRLVRLGGEANMDFRSLVNQLKSDQSAQAGLCHMQI